MGYGLVVAALAGLSMNALAREPAAPGPAEVAPPDSMRAPSAADSVGASSKPPSSPSAPDSAYIGNVIPLNQFGKRISAYPYAYYTPETEFAFGVGGIITFYTDEDLLLRPSKATVSAYTTAKDQYKVTLSPEVYFKQNKIFGSLDLDYGRYVDKFYGVGNSTPEIENSDYVTRGWGVRTELQVPPFLGFLSSTRIGVIYEFAERDITADLGNPYLTDGSVSGAEAGSISGAGLSWVWDSRDHIFYPTSGGFHRVSAVYYMDGIGSDYDYNRYEVDLRQYFGKKDAHVFAFQLLWQATFGTPPFYELPALGGQQIMRGYYEGRYRDRVYLAGQAEYRTHLWWKLGAVAFLGAGDVGHDFSDFYLRDFKISGGAGLRLLFNEKEGVNLRMDLGFGTDTNGTYFALEEAF